MSVGLIDQTLLWANDQALAEDIRFWEDRGKQNGVDIGSASAWLAQRDGDGALELTTGNGRIVIVDNVVGLRVAQGDMETLAGGSASAPTVYDLEVLVTDTNGGQGQIRGVVHLLDGLGG